MAQRFVHIISGLSVGGAEHQLLRLIEFQKDQASSHVVVALKGCALAPAFEATGCEVILLKLNRFWQSGKAFKRLCQLCQQTPVKRIDCWLYHSHVLGSLLRFIFRLKAPLVFHVRSGLHGGSGMKRLTRGVLYLSRGLSYRANRVVFNSDEVFVQHQQLGFCMKKACVMHNGFNVEAPVKNLTLYENFRKQKVPQNTFLVGMLCRFHPVKGLDVLIKALSIVFQQNDTVCGVIAGPRVAENRQHILAPLEAVFHHRILLLPPMDSAQFLPVLDVGCVPSYSEAFSNVLVEMMLSELFVLSTNVGAAGQLLGPDHLLEVGDHQALAKKIEQAANLDEKQRLKVGAAMRKRVFEQFSMQAMNERYQVLV